jgi:clan AA aspartic protease (TIGR02281 family)
MTISRTFLIVLAAAIALPLYLMLGGGLFAYSALTSLDQRGGIDATASGRPSCNTFTETTLGQPTKKVVIQPPYAGPQVYVADVCVNASAFGMIVTQNVSHVILTWNQAVEMDLKPRRLNFDTAYRYGAKTGSAAKVVLGRVKIGDIEMFDVEALVAKDHDLYVGLVGKTFLSRLKRSGVNRDKNMVLIGI